MVRKIIMYLFIAIAAIPILLWFAIKGMFKGGWRLLGFICQQQYRELKRLCECGTAAELQAFLTAHPGALEYVIYTHQGQVAAAITTLFRLPSPLSVAGKANNLAVIPILLSNGASPEVRSISEMQTPAEEAIGSPRRMRALCNGKTWWRERPGTNNELLATSIRDSNLQGIIWHTLRGAQLTEYKEVCSPAFLRLPVIIKEFICRFAISEERLKAYHHQLKQFSDKEQKEIYILHPHTPFGKKGISLQKEFGEMVLDIEKSLRPLPPPSSDTINNLLLSSGLMGRPQLLKLLDNLFTNEQLFSMLNYFLQGPLQADSRELTEETVDLLLCSILARAGT